ncbi:hypothetical protein ALC56_10072 [Trachymyrmex septentrionalis]|uniref:Uncharacterized protein n=1 Tax=Trachymyrmex septentrionalis TaxID=34720 RepID=A0A195F4K7_9HYME|nr:hypothetical protein ALC56_10072 [Trachymyrmex septentrionalis]
MWRVQMHRDALPVELNVSTCCEQEDVHRFLDTEPRQDLVETFTDFNRLRRRTARGSGGPWRVSLKGPKNTKPETRRAVQMSSDN